MDEALLLDRTPSWASSSGAGGWGGLDGGLAMAGSVLRTFPGSPT